MVRTATPAVLPSAGVRTAQRTSATHHPDPTRTRDPGAGPDRDEADAANACREEAPVAVPHAPSGSGRVHEMTFPGSALPLALGRWSLGNRWEMAVDEPVRATEVER